MKLLLWISADDPNKRLLPLFDDPLRMGIRIPVSIKSMGVIDQLESY